MWLGRICHDAKFGKDGLLDQAVKEAGVQNGVEVEQLDVTDAASIRLAVASTLSQTGKQA